MATTHIVSLFLPNTISFSELPPKERSSSSVATLQRVGSTIGLASEQSPASLFPGTTTPATTPGHHPETGSEYFPHRLRNDPETTPKRQHTRFGSRALIQSDAQVPHWGSPVFNQPRSRAAPLPSASIQDFAKVYEELKEQEEKSNLKRIRADRPVSSPPSFRSRNPSSERGYEGHPWTVEEAIHGNGGLFNAIAEVCDDNKDLDITWIGTLGFPTDALSTNIKDEIHDKLLNEHRSEVVYCCDKDLDGHYSHYCKTILWPIFHYQVPDHPKSKAYADHSWDYYRNVNQSFADKVIASYKRGDTIWIHDYHLLLVPGMVREKLRDARIGFFLHTAFPSSEIFRCLATRQQLLEGMLGASLIAFQTEEYAEHFLQTCSRLMSIETTAEGVQLDDHFVNVTSQAIGINPPLIEEARAEPDVQSWIKLISEKYADKHIIVARDKLDNVHGVRQKLLAYELFLNKYPDWKNNVVLIQVATSTDEQSELLTTVSDICTRIDMYHSTLANQPLVFLKQDIAFSEYLALLTVADVLMISALRDGMNLSVHEYILCQDGRGHPKKHGPIILSEFTGSASIFGRSHISINPWDYHKQADAIKLALEMEDDEKAARWRHLHNTVLSGTGGNWMRELSKTLDRVYAEHLQRESAAVPRLSFSMLAERYKHSERRLFIIDYEGTLAPHKTSTGIPLGSPVRVTNTLGELMQDDKNIVYVMSGRRPEELDTDFRTLPKVGLIAENGCFVRDFGGCSGSTSNHEWTQFTDAAAVGKWKAEVKQILTYHQERLEGSVIEERHCSLLFRYDRAADPDAAVRQAGECADQINGTCKDSLLPRVHAVPVPHSKAVLIEQADLSKGTAAKHILADLNKKDAHDAATGLVSAQPDFMLIAGDDREDEVIYRWANDLSAAGTIAHVFTVTVGKRNTQAQATLSQGSTGLVTVLQKLAKISMEPTS